LKIKISIIKKKWQFSRKHRNRKNLCLLWNFSDLHLNLFPIIYEDRTPLAKSFFSRVSSTAFTADHSVPLVALQAQVIFPLRSVATRDVRHWRARDSEVRNEVVTRFDKSRDSLVRDGVTRRVREAAFFIFHRPPRFATVLPHLSDGSAVLSHVDNRHGIWWPREETEGIRAERNSDLGQRRSYRLRRRARRLLSLEGKKKYPNGAH